MGNTIDMNELEPVARPLLPIFLYWIHQEV